MTSKSRKVTRRVRALGLALVASLAFGALAASSASALNVSWPVGAAVNLSWQNTGALFASEDGTNVECTGSSGNMNFTSPGTTGSTALASSGCTMAALGTKLTCTSAGAVSGEVRATVLRVTPVYLDAGKTKFGLKFEPWTAGNPFAEFTCGGVVKVKWTGSVIGLVTKPALNTPATSVGLSFIYGVGGGKQQFEQVEGAGPKYHLSQQIGGGTIYPLSVTKGGGLNVMGGTTVTFKP